MPSIASPSLLHKFASGAVSNLIVGNGHCDSASYRRALAIAGRFGLIGFLNDLVFWQANKRANRRHHARQRSLREHDSEPLAA